MTIRSDIQRRLVKLEGAASALRDGTDKLGWFARIAVGLLAFHLGDLQPEEPLMAGYARALNYDGGGDLRQGVNDGEAIQRHKEAVERLLELRGAGPSALADASWEEQVGLLDALFRGLPDWLVARLNLPVGVTAADVWL